MKKAIALAIAAALAAPLAAQAEVKISGGLQAEILSMSGDTVKEGLYVADGQEGGTPDSGNFGSLNFSASEDLGNGMKALAKVGMNVWAADHGTKGVGARDAYVGLSGDFGTVLAGRMSSPYKMSTVKWDPFLATSAQARGNYGMSGWHNSYLENVVAYANKFGMAKVVAAVSFDEADKDTTDATQTSGDHATTISVNMPVGPVEVALAYLSATDMGTATAGADTGDNTATKLGVKYTAGAISVAGQYEALKTDAGDDTTMYINATYTAGANTFAAAYGTNDLESAGDTKPTYMSVGMVHSFSKMTSAHVAYIGLDDDAGNTDSGIAAGLRVKF